MVAIKKRDESGGSSLYIKIVMVFLPVTILLLSFSTRHQCDAASYYGLRFGGSPRFQGNQRLFIRQQHPRVATRQVSTWQEFQRLYGNGEGGTALNPEEDAGTGRASVISQSCSDEERFLCEECTKSARNEVVFPLCCGKRQGMFEWCQRFMNFELKSD